MKTLATFGTSKLTTLVQDAQAIEKRAETAWGAVLGRLRKEIDALLLPDKGMTVKGPGWSPYFFIRPRDKAQRTFKCRVELEISLSPYPALFKVILQRKGKGPSHRSVRNAREVSEAFRVLGPLFGLEKGQIVTSQPEQWVRHRRCPVGETCTARCVRSPSKLSCDREWQLHKEKETP